MTFLERPPRHRILIIDDEEDAFVIMRHLLKRVGASEEIEWLSDGACAVQQLRELAVKGDSLPVLVILDLKMAGMTGFEVLQSLRSLPALSSLLIVVMSSSSLPEDIARALRLGAFCYFEKFPLPEKFAPVYQLAQHRLAPACEVPDACETALRRIVGLVEDALAVFHASRAPHAEVDRTLLNMLGGIRRSATERLLERLNQARGPGRWPFPAQTSTEHQIN